MSADFLDANVSIDLFDDADTRKRVIVVRLVSDALSSGRAVVSYQVVHEAVDVVLDPLWQVGPGSGVYGAALDLHGRHGFCFHDALIVASALAAGCTRLLSADLQRGQRIGDLVVVVDPVRDAPDAGSRQATHALP